MDRCSGLNRRVELKIIKDIEKERKKVVKCDKKKKKMEKNS